MTTCLSSDDTGGVQESNRSGSPARYLQNRQQNCVAALVTLPTSMAVVEEDLIRGEILSAFSGMIVDATPMVLVKLRR